jgi:serine/threonine protein kinase
MIEETTTKESESTPAPLPVVTAGESGTKGLCTLHYRPPEILLGGSASHPSVDMYSTGIVLAELIGGKTLWAGQNILDQLSIIFDAIGTPDEITWPAVKDLPDYGKLTFTKKTPKPWDVILPRAAECPPLFSIMSQLIVLNPMERLSAKQASSQLSAVESSSTSILKGASREQLRNELILPLDLKVFPMLFTNDQKLMSQMALRHVKTRKSFLSSYQPQHSTYNPTSSAWQGPNVSPKDHQQLSNGFMEIYGGAV